MKDPLRSHPTTGTKLGDVITAEVSLTLDPAKVKLRRFAAASFDDGVADWFAQAIDGATVELLVDVLTPGKGSLRLKNRSLLVPVARDPRQVELERRIRDDGGFINPYTFVPTLPRADLLDGPGDNGLGDSGSDGPPSHARIGPDQWSGTLTVKLRTLAPLLLPDTDHPVIADGQPKTFTTRVDRDHRPLITGSALKGALRCAFETVTASRYGVFLAHERQLAYRAATRIRTRVGRWWPVTNEQPIARRRTP